MVDTSDLANLRPMMPVRALADLFGADWVPPEDKWNGYVFPKPGAGFSAQIDREGRIGSVSFHGTFPAGLVIEGMHLGMTLAEARHAHPGMERDEPEETERIEAYKCPAPDANELKLRFRDGVLLGFQLFRPGLIYPEAKRPKDDPRIAKAYDINILPRSADRASSDNHGWCFGLPPGITPLQWPLDPRTGHPMRHAFTLLLPQEYRVKGADLVAVSLFGTDWAGDSTYQNGAVADIWDSVSGPPENSELLPVWQHRTGRHAHEYRMNDLLDEPYAVIWLTRAEFDGPLCSPPLNSNGTLSHDLPRWTAIGAAAAYVEAEYSPHLSLPIEDYGIVKQLGGVPHNGLEFDRALQWTPRVKDPNAGLALPWGWEDTTPTGYQTHWNMGNPKEYTLQDWAEAHQPNHIGGTMRPVQAYPDPGFSPAYIEFQEYFGGFNFGGDGCAQLDLAQMRLEWACG